MNKKELEKEIEEVKLEIQELENLNTDKMIDVSEDLKNAKEKLSALERIAEGKLTAWEKVELARNPKRPTSLDLIEKIFDDFMELHGDRTSTDDKAIVCGLASLNGQNYTIIAEQKGRNTKDSEESKDSHGNFGRNIADGNFPKIHLTLKNSRLNRNFRNGSDNQESGQQTEFLKLRYRRLQITPTHDSFSQTTPNTSASYFHGIVGHRLHQHKGRTSESKSKTKT